MSEENETKDLIAATLSGSGGLIIATISGSGAEPETLLYPVSTQSGTIIRDSTSYAGVDITKSPDYFEVMTETTERSKGPIGRRFQNKIYTPRSTRWLWP